MLKIKNINKIVGLHANGKMIIHADDYTDTLRKSGKDYFVFKIEGDDGVVRGYNKEHEIVLSKRPNVNGKYDMFNMGLQMTTEIEIDKDQIKSPNDLSHCIRNVLMRTQTYYQQNN
jgi:hypothetical protein